MSVLWGADSLLRFSFIGGTIVLANRAAENPEVVWNCQILNYIIGPFSHTGMGE